MNARGTDEEVFACVLTCGVSARQTAGEKTQRGGGDGNVRKRGWERAVCGAAGKGRRSARARERARVSAWPYARVLARKHERAIGSSRVRKRRRESHSVCSVGEKRRESTRTPKSQCPREKHLGDASLRYALRKTLVSHFAEAAFCSRSCRQLRNHGSIRI